MRESREITRGKRSRRAGLPPRMAAVIAGLAVLGVLPGAWGEENGMNREAVLAGGCFWCMEPPFASEEGVLEVVPGYAGGRTPNPTYEEVSSGRTGYREAVRIVYDPRKITFEQLLDIFWRNIDPTDRGGQFADRGGQYKTAVFVANEEERKIAEASKKALQDSGRFKDPVVTEILMKTPFYEAEEYHREYYRKNPLRYKAYKKGSGREGFLEGIWAD